jgi:hypothetical protein
LIELQGKFARFYIDRCFYNDPNVLVSFVKENENLFQSSSYLPRQFAGGAAVQTLTILLLLAAALFRFEHLVYHRGYLKEGNPAAGNRVFKIGKEEFRIFFVKRASVVQRLFTHLSGKVKADEKQGIGIPFEIAAGEKTGEAAFTYVCHPDEFSDACVKDFLDFMGKFFQFPETVKAELSQIIKKKGIEKKYFRQLEDGDKGGVLLLAFAPINTPVFLLDDIAKGIPVEFYFQLNDTFKNAAASGSVVIYLTSNCLILDNRFEADEDVAEIGEWSKMVETIEAVNEK